MIEHDFPETDTWQDSLSRGDIVLFRFPEVNGDGVAKMRPCLVLEIDGAGSQRQTTLAYGTTSRSSANRGYEIRIKRRSSLAIAGLDRQGRFVCARTTTVSLDHPHFGKGLRETPVIGYLDTYLTERMHAVRERLQIEGGIAAEIRRNKSEERLRGRDERAVLAVEQQRKGSSVGTLRFFK